MARKLVVKKSGDSTKGCKLAEIHIKKGDTGHVLEEHFHDADGSPLFGAKVKVHAFSSSPADAKKLVKHVINKLDLPIDAQDDDDDEDQNDQDQNDE